MISSIIVIFLGVIVFGFGVLWQLVESGFNHNVIPFKTYSVGIILIYIGYMNL